MRPNEILDRIFLHHFLPLLTGQCAQLLSDNATTVACLLHQGTLQSDPLMDLLVTILEYCFHHSILFIPKHLSGSINVLTNPASCVGSIAMEWSLDFGPFQLGLFATSENHQLPICFLLPEPGGHGDQCLDTVEPLGLVPPFPSNIPTLLAILPPISVFEAGRF